jgi:hypothetical protein
VSEKQDPALILVTLFIQTDPNIVQQTKLGSKRKERLVKDHSTALFIYAKHVSGPTVVGQ